MKTKFDIIRDGSINPLYQMMRDGSLRIDMEDVYVVRETGNVGPLRVPAWISMVQDRLYLNLRGVPQQADFKEAISHFGRLQGKSVTVRASDCFEVRAQTEKGVPILLEGVTPVIGRGSSHYSHAGGSRSHERIDFQRVAFPAGGMDAMNSEGHRQHLRQAIGKESEVDEAPTKRIPKDEFYAILPDVEQRIFNGGTETETKHPFFGKLSSSNTDCLTGQVNGGEFCLEKHDTGMLIHFHCPVEGSTQEKARSKLDGLLQAIAFIHGCNPWPDYFCHRRDRRVVERWINPRAQLQREPLRPLSDGDLISYSSGKGEKLFLAAARFFAQASEDASRFNKALWLMREACREGTPQEISVLTLCSVFDGIIKPHRGKKKEGDDLRQYRWINPIESKLGMAFDFFEPAIEYWDIYRNPLAHGFGFDEAPSEDQLEILDAYAFLFGAIYQVMARQMGFKESMPQSMFGSKPTKKPKKKAETKDD